MTSVLIVQERLATYRVPFFAALRERLHAVGISLHVVHGDPSLADASRADEGELSWSATTPLHRIGVSGRYLTWQEVAGFGVRPDYVVVEHAARHLTAYPLIVASRTGGPRVALWGHGSNLQSRGGLVDAVGNACKRALVRSADWYFAYTLGSASRFIRAGARPERVTVVQNSADTTWARHMAAAPGGYVCAFVGSLHAYKKLDWLVDAAEYMGRRLPEFELRVIGDGPLREWLVSRIEHTEFINWYGRRDGGAKADVLAPAVMLLNPGLVGLVAIDSFASGRPIATTSAALHSPEMEYLRHGDNAFVFDVTSPTEFARSATEALINRSWLASVQATCRADASRYSLDAMVDNFYAGIVNWTSCR